VDAVVCSTDSPEIAERAREAGAEVGEPRPANLADDTASSGAVLAHVAAAHPDYGVLALLQPTSPLRTAEDIDLALRTFDRHRADSCRSVVEVTEHPWLMYRVEETTDELIPAVPDRPDHVRRQEYPRFFRLNGAIYIVSTASLERTGSLVGDHDVAYVMAASRSLDIDTREDYERLLALVEADRGPGAVHLGGNAR